MTPTPPTPTPPRERLLPASAALLAAVLLGCLGWLAQTGTLVRYWADDYCYSYVIQAGGPLNGPVNWFMASGNRFSTILLVGLQDAFGPAAIRWLPALVLLVWVLGWLVFLSQLAKLFHARLTRAWALVFALLQVFFAALLAPDRLQTLYWRMGTLHYTFPLILLLLTLALAAAALRRPGHGGLWAAGFFLLAFFAGGFSETYAALQAGLYGLVSVWALIFARGAFKRASLWVWLPALFGAAAAMLLELLSPSNVWRQAALPPPASLSLLIQTILLYTADFARDTLLGLPLPLSVLALLSAALAYAGFWRWQPSLPTPRMLLLGAAASLGLGVLLSACAIAPSAYAGLQFPAGRALMPVRFALLCGWTGAAACLGALPCHFTPRSPRQAGLTAALTALILLAGAAYLLHASAGLSPQRAELAAWAARWDRRDAEIRSLRAAGQTRLHVRQVEVVAGLEDIGPDPLNWVNRCTAGYYQLGSITATP